jgi:hypothetical protein
MPAMPALFFERLIDRRQGRVRGGAIWCSPWIEQGGIRRFYIITSVLTL